MSDFDGMNRKIRRLCEEYISLKKDNQRLLEEEARLKEKISTLEEQTRSVRKISQQNELLNKERQEIKTRLNNLRGKLEKAF